MNFLENEFFLLAVTFGIFFLAKLLQKKTGIMLLNPILLTIAILIVFLKMTHISYETYNEGGHLIEFWLKPAAPHHAVTTCRLHCGSYLCRADS